MGPSVSCSVCATCHELYVTPCDWLTDYSDVTPTNKTDPHWADHGYHGVVAVLRLLLAVEWRWWPHSCAHTVPLSGTPQVGHSELGAGIYHHISSLSWAGHMAYFDTCPQGIFSNSNYWEFWGRGCPIHWRFGLWLPTNIYLDLAIIISNKILNFVFSIDHEDQRQQVTNIISYVCRRLIECSECRTGSNNEDDLPLRPPRYNCVASAAGHRRHGHLRRLWYLHWLLPKLQI